MCSMASAASVAAVSASVTSRRRREERDVRTDPVALAGVGAEAIRQSLAEPALDPARGDRDDLGLERVVEGIGEQRLQRVGERVGSLSSVDVKHWRFGR